MKFSAIELRFALQNALRDLHTSVIANNLPWREPNIYRKDNSRFIAAVEWTGKEANMFMHFFEEDIVFSGISFKDNSSALPVEETTDHYDSYTRFVKIEHIWLG